MKFANTLLTLVKKPYLICELDAQIYRKRVKGLTANSTGSSSILEAPVSPEGHLRLDRTNAPFDKAQLNQQILDDGPMRLRKDNPPAFTTT
ncbi:hypothetical protein OK016_11970 [Vibrio chagasii]|nr:hypothetical protein [Vibrio chagasii]